MFKRKFDSCELCGKKPKSLRHIIYFKGKYICWICKGKIGHPIYIPTSTPSEGTLKSISMNGETIHLPRASYKNHKKSHSPEEISIGAQRQKSIDLFIHLPDINDIVVSDDLPKIVDVDFKKEFDKLMKEKNND